MNAITSLYIPCVEKTINVEFIANSFDKMGIAKVSRISIESIKCSSPRRSNEYNRVYIGINSWHDTEAAYNFIQRLRDPRVEARFNYGDDNWWPVSINLYPHKLSANKKRTLTVFRSEWSDKDTSSADKITDELQAQFYGFNSLKDMIIYDQKPAPLQRQSAAWDIEHFEECQQLLGEPLTFENEELYFLCREQKYAWVDQLLEKMESDNRYRYEEPTFEDEREPFFEQEEYPEDDEEEKFRAFQQEADDWYEDMMEDREHAKRTLPPKEFKKWEDAYEKSMTKRQKDFELYLKTGFPIY